MTRKQYRKAAGQRGNHKLKDFCGQRARRTSAERAYKGSPEIAGRRPESAAYEEEQALQIWVAPRSIPVLSSQCTGREYLFIWGIPSGDAPGMLAYPTGVFVGGD